MAKNKIGEPPSLLEQDIQTKLFPMLQWIYEAYRRISKAWVYEETAFAGIWSADGSTTVKLPTGWSLNKTGTGTYTVTHNLGLSNVNNLVVVCSAGGANVNCNPLNLAANTFDIYSYDSANAAVDAVIHFHAYLYDY